MSKNLFNINQTVENSLSVRVTKCVCNCVVSELKNPLDTTYCCCPRKSSHIILRLSLSKLVGDII